MYVDVWRAIGAETACHVPHGRPATLYLMGCASRRVIRVSTIKPVLVAMTFVCAKCGYECKRHLPDGKYEPPSSCLGCKSKSLVPDRSTAVTVDWQRVRLQEIVTDDSREEGRMPRTIECELSEDLVDHCVPGDEVTVSGVVKVVSTEGESKGSKNKCLFLLYIEANSIANPKKNTDGGVMPFPFSHGLVLHTHTHTHMSGGSALRLQHFGQLHSFVGVCRSLY
jgi:DNA replicative helicase MCM subunit Mcm2 (Cdc46/Mcm family)